MIIHPPEIVEEADLISVGARIEFQTSGIRFPETLWFKLSKSCSPFIVDRVDGFAVALLPLAMILGEGLEIRGEVSPRLAYGMQEYQRIQHIWWPDRFNRIPIQCNDLKPINTYQDITGVGCAFSGGVDSFYTLWSHLSQNEHNPYYRISHALMINGFDFNADIDNVGVFSHKARQLYEPVMKKIGVNILFIHTNLRRFVTEDMRSWQSFLYTFGSALAACALVFGHLFSRFYIASSNHYSQLHPWGSHPFIDRLLRTESMEIIHDALHLTRLEKIAILSQWSETYARLRTCLYDAFLTHPTSDLKNCCRCEQCIHTVSALDMLGALDKYTVFPKPLFRKNIRNLIFNYTNNHQYFYVREIIAHAKKIGRRDIAFDYRCTIILNVLFYRWLLKLHVRLKRRSKFYLRFFEFIRRKKD